MNLISFPAWTCGGLFCDILNKTMSPLDNNGGMGLPAHKSKLIVHSSTPDDNILLQEVINKTDLTEDIWVGTHTYPDNIDLSQFDKVIVVNLTTQKSITYRYARIFYQCIYGNGINKNRKSYDPSLWGAKNHPILSATNVYNIEFENVVEWNEGMLDFIINYTDVSDYSFIENRKKVWQDLNHFLYDKNFIQACEMKLTFV